MTLQFGCSSAVGVSLDFCMVKDPTDQIQLPICLSLWLDPTPSWCFQGLELNIICCHERGETFGVESLRNMS